MLLMNTNNIILIIFSGIILNYTFLIEEFSLNETKCVINKCSNIKCFTISKCVECSLCK